MLRREAAQWLARLEGGDDPSVKQGFQRWYGADPANAAAFDRVRQSYASAGLLRHSEQPPGRPLAAREARNRIGPQWAVAAAIAVALVGSGAILLTLGVPATQERNTVLLASGVGEIRQVRLEDGSKVILDTATAVDVEFGRSGRRAILREGRARFEVATDPRPFVIEADATAVRSESGIVEIGRLGDGVRVEVREGRATAEVGGGERPTMVALEAGEGILAGRALNPYRVAADGSAWTRGMLRFDGTPLGEAVAEANRYSSQKIALGEGIARLRVTGAFRAGDIPAFARSLAEAFDLELQRLPSGDFRLKAPTAAATGD